MFILSDRVAIFIPRRAEGRGKGHTEGEEGIGFTGDSAGASEKIFNGEGSAGGGEGL